MIFNQIIQIIQIKSLTMKIRNWLNLIKGNTYEKNAILVKILNYCALFNGRNEGLSPKYKKTPNTF